MSLQMRELSQNHMETYSRSMFNPVPDHGLVLINWQIRADPETYQNYIWQGLAQSKEATWMVCGSQSECV